MKRLNFILIILVYLIQIDKQVQFDSLIDELKAYTFFQENGVKVEYKIDTDINQELIRLEEAISSKYKQEINIKDNTEIYLDTDNEQVLADVYNDKNQTLVEIKIINFDNQKSLSNLMKELTELQANNSKQIKYFKYFKGKILNEKGIIEQIKNTQKLKKLEALDIHNGCVGTANLNDGQRVNFVISNYNSGTYFTIGTPIIFTIY